MKAIIFKGIKIGTITGSVLAVLYMFIVLITVEFSLPLSEPSETVIFTSNFLPSIIGTLLVMSPIWFFVPIIIGCLTSMFFNIVLIQFHPSKHIFLSTCLLFCLVIIMCIYLPFKNAILFQLGLGDVGFGVNRYLMILNPLIGIILLISPGLIYLITGLIISNIQYTKFNSP